MIDKSFGELFYSLVISSLKINKKFLLQDFI